jgi:hypothetical protein
LSVPSCSGLGSFAFVGGLDSNVAGALADGVLAGYQNEVCDSNSSIAGGYVNIISSGGQTAANSFIGGGLSNTITGGAEFGVIGGGTGNTLTGGGRRDKRRPE